MRWYFQRHYSLLILLFGAASGMFLGLGLFTFHYAKGAAYLRDDPKACVNCHVMNEYYDAWQKASHHHTTTCNACHTPSDFFGKYTTKAVHGIRHSWGFTTGLYAEPIEIKVDSLRVVEQNCRRCHGELFHGGEGEQDQKGSISCLSCHREVGHVR